MWTKGMVTFQRSPFAGHYHLGVKMPTDFGAKPGQFVMLRSWETDDPLLPRPFSVYRIHDGDGFEVLYKQVGKGTELMTHLKAGDEVHVLGPLGNGFPLAPDTKRIALVARGIGAAPLMALGEEASRRGVEVWSYLSACHQDLLPGQDDFKDISARLSMLTDDMPRAKGRLVTDDLAKDASREMFDAVYVCGSRRLTRAVAGMEERLGFQGFVTLEAHMACGVGACKGCVRVVRADLGRPVYKCVCKDGPVFPIREVAD